MKIDIEKIKKIITETTDEIERGNLMVHLRAYQQSRQAYSEEATAAHLRDWQAAEQALQERVREVEGGAAGDATALDTISAILEYLQPDWRVTKTSLYRHQKEGKLIPRADGTYTAKDIEKYARTWLKQKSTGKKISESTDELQRKKLIGEIRNSDLEYDRKKLAHDRELGKLIARELMEVELATRAGVLDAGLKHWVQSRAPEWIRAVGGDTKKVGDLINLMNRDLDEHINSYAAAMDYQVVIDVAGELMEEVGA